MAYDLPTELMDLRRYMYHGPRHALGHHETAYIDFEAERRPERRGAAPYKCGYVKRDGSRCDSGSRLPGGCHRHRGRKAALQPAPCDRCSAMTIARHVRELDVGPVPLCAKCSNYIRQNADKRRLMEDTSRRIIEEARLERLKEYVDEVLSWWPCENASLPASQKEPLAGESQPSTDL
jgi:hypothetical protein